MNKYRVTITRNWRGWPIKFKRVGIGKTETSVITNVVAEYANKYRLDSIINISWEVVA